MTEDSFSRCIRLLADGDMQGLKEIYEEYGKMIFSTALSVCRNAHTAEDITSEFFLRLSSAAPLYREGTGHKKWLVVSARNLTIDHLRRHGRETLISAAAGDEEAHPLSDIPDSCDTEEKVAARLTAEDMLNRLGQAEREVFNLKVYCGFTLSEIASLLHIPLGTAAWRYRLAVERLRRLYGEVRI